MLRITARLKPVGAPAAITAMERVAPAPDGSMALAAVRVYSLQRPRISQGWARPDVPFLMSQHLAILKPVSSLGRRNPSQKGITMTNIVLAARVFPARSLLA